MFERSAIFLSIFIFLGKTIHYNPIKLLYQIAI